MSTTIATTPGPAPLSETLRRVVVLPEVLASAGLALAIGLAAWPAFTLILLIVVAILALAQRHPGAALVAAIGLFLIEGTVKVLFTNGALPLDRPPLATGAAMLDLALFGTIVTILVRAPRPDLRAAWGRRTTPERVVLGAAAGWLALSVLQVPFSPSLENAMEGLRLTQSYVLATVAAAIVFANPRARSTLVPALLGVLIVLMLYAALRGLFGAHPAERALALARGGVVSYGDAIRAVGTFSSGIALGTAAAPAAVFGVVLGAFSHRYRVPALGLAACALVAELATYGRTPIVATVVAVGFAGVFALLSSASRGWKNRVGVVFAACLVLLVAGSVVAAQSSPRLSERLEGIVRPGQDESLRVRFQAWDYYLDAARAEPLGRGIGTVGRASSEDRVHVVTTDSSYLKVLVEQGPLGATLFVVALFGGVALVASRLATAPPGSRDVGIAALCGFVSFVVLMATNETIEQPGKVLAWTFLGIAIAVAWRPGGAEPPGGGPPVRAWLRRSLEAARRPDPRLLRWGGAGAALFVAIVMTLTLTRSANFTLDVPVFARSTPPLAKPSGGADYIERLASGPGVWFAVARSDGVFGIPSRNLRRELHLIDNDRPEAALVAARSPTQDRSADLLRAFARALAATSVFDLRETVGKRLEVIRDRLRQTRSPSRRARLRARAMRYVQLRAAGTPRIVFAPLPDPHAYKPFEKQLNYSDRIVDGLPGPFPQRPNPWMLTLVLIVVLLAAYLAAVLLGQYPAQPRSRR